MGYKYGVWYTYYGELFNLHHQGHFTVTCFMEKCDAIRLYEELKTKFGTTNMIYTNCKEPVIFKANLYDDDTNDINSWGYTGTVLNWDEIKKVTDNYSCNFSHQPHTSMVYTKDSKNILPVICGENRIINGTLNVIDICSDNPSEWEIIKL